MTRKDKKATKILKTSLDKRKMTQQIFWTFLKTKRNQREEREAKRKRVPPGSLPTNKLITMFKIFSTSDIL
jgi:hypothetical protein